MTALSALVQSFQRAQRAENRSPHTIRLYRQCLTRLVGWLNLEYDRDDLSLLNRRTLTDYFAVRGSTVAPITLWTDYKTIRVFVRWLVDEEELSDDPMAKMKPPKQTAKPVDAYSNEEVERLIAACDGRGYRDRRRLRCTPQRRLPESARARDRPSSLARGDPSAPGVRTEAANEARAPNR